MFDIGFPELVLIAVVGLLVIGPEKLPHAIRTLSLWIGRLQRSFTNLRREFENEIGADEIRQQLHNESILKELKDAQQTIQDTGQDIKQVIRTAEEEAKLLTATPPPPPPTTPPTTAPETGKRPK